MVVCCLGAFTQGQEVQLEPERINEFAKLGVLKLSGEPEINLEFPEGFVGDEIRGRVLLVNDSQTDAPVSDVQTSCGCTSAIPVHRTVASGKQDLLLIHYQPKSAGQRLVEARFTFGEKIFRLRGVAKTLNRFQQVTSKLTFDHTGRVSIELRKNASTVVDRLVVRPPTFKVEKLSDTETAVVATIRRDPTSKDTPSHIIVSPAHGETAHEEFRFDLQYPGVIEVFPKRVIVKEDSLRFYVRGDVGALEGADQITLVCDGKTSVIPCEVSLTNGVLFVTTKNTLGAGDHRVSAQIRDVSFSLLVTVR